MAKGYYLINYQDARNYYVRDRKKKGRLDQIKGYGVHGICKRSYIRIRAERIIPIKPRYEGDAYTVEGYAVPECYVTLLGRKMAKEVKD